LFRSFGRVKWVILCSICLFTVLIAVLLAFTAMGRATETIAKSGLTASSKKLSSSAAASSALTVAPLVTANAVKQLDVAKINGLKAVWITASDFLPAPGLSVDKQKAAIDAVINNVASMKMNTIFLQVRTGASALYKSQYFPWSETLTGTQGKDPGYDPLAYFIQQAHNKGVQIQAWVTPYTIGAKADLTKFAANNPCIINPGLVVTGEDGTLYFDPGNPYTQKLIESSIQEIAQNYNLDGILMDNFYPSKNFGDSKSYAKYGGVMALEDWRRDNVDKLIEAVHTDIKALNKSLPFGISPYAVWANQAQYAPGSDTSSAIQTYYDQFADTRLWIQHGWVDYVCPQIHWSLGFPATSFEKVTDWWVNTVKGTSVNLYISQAVFKEGTNEAGWSSPDQIVKQLQFLKKYPECKGSAFSGYQQLMKNTGGMTDCIKTYYDNKLDVSFGTTLVVGAPKNNLVTTESQVNITGTSDSNFPLTLNGKPVARSTKGLFAMSVQLTPGKNTFTLVHKGITQVINVTYSVDVLKSIGPSQNILESGSTQIGISAVAHKDASVYATVGGTRINMSPTADTGNDNSDAPALATDYISYAGTYTLPASKTTVQNLGNVKVTASWSGFSKSMTGGNIQVKNYVPVAAGIRQIAILKKGAAEQFMPYIEAYIYDSLYRPIADPQLADSWDYIETNPDGSPRKFVIGNSEYYKLSNGEMIFTYNADIVAEAPPANNKINSVNQSSFDNGRYTRFVFGFSQKITYNAGTNVNYPNVNKAGVRDYTISSFNATTFQITFYNTDQAANVGVLSNPLFSSVDCNQINGTTVQYVFHLKNAGVFYGSYISYDGNNLVIDFKNPWDGNFSNLKISIDAGHGGIDIGAPSPTHSPDEKGINLAYAMMTRDKLIAMGVKPSNIYMTRTSDIYSPSPMKAGETMLEYKARVLSTRRVDMVNFRPDFTLCIHNDAHDTTAVGSTSYYYQPYSQPLARAVQTLLVQAFQAGKTADGGAYNYPRMGTDRGAIFVKENAYYSIRQIEVPSILVECGYADNPSEFQFLASPTGTDLITSALAQGVMNFVNSEKKYS
jgi:uncharacterized lipoprotein YddW (UPF0748 family)/N-acetylmuramoyl-L-alanine amidase